MNVPQEV